MISLVSGLRFPIPALLLKVRFLWCPNYLLIYLDVKNAKPGTFDLTFTKDKKTFKMPYELKARKADACKIKGFDSSDVLYLIMPDRFANGNPQNDNIPLKTTYKTDRTNPNAAMAAI